MRSSSRKAGSMETICPRSTSRTTFGMTSAFGSIYCSGTEILPVPVKAYYSRGFVRSPHVLRTLELGSTLRLLDTLMMDRQSRGRHPVIRYTEAQLAAMLTTLCTSTCTTLLTSYNLHLPTTCLSTAFKPSNGHITMNYTKTAQSLHVGSKKCLRSWAD